MRSAKNEELLTIILHCFFAAAAKEKLDKKRVDQAVADVKHIFSEKPETKYDRCLICSNISKD